MVVSFAILQGFRNEIQNKIFSFGAHLQISRYDTNNSLEVAPIGGPRVAAALHPVFRRCNTPSPMPSKRPSSKPPTRCWAW